MVHDASTGDELNCDTWVVSKKDGKEKNLKGDRSVTDGKDCGH